MEMTTAPSSVTFCPHPLLAADRVSLDWLPGETLIDIIARLAIPDHVPLAVAVDGARVPTDQWATLRPQAGQLITIRTLMGKDGSNPVSIVLQLALAYFAPGIGNAIGEMAFGEAMLVGNMAGFTIVSKLAAGAISMVGNAVIGAVFKPHTNAISSSNGLAIPQASPTYNLMGSQNRLRPFEPLPLIYGRHRFVPDLASKPYTFYKGRDQYLRQIFNCGLSDLVLTDWRIGDTPLSSYSNWTMREANPDGRIEGFHDNVDTLDGGALAPSTWITRTLSAGTEAVDIDIQGVLFAIDPEEGGMLPLSCNFALEYREVGTATWLKLTTGTLPGQYTHYWSAGHDVAGLWQQVASGTTRSTQYVEGAAYVPPRGSVYYNDGNSYTWHWLAYADAAHIPAAQKPAQDYLQTIDYLQLTSSTRDTIRRTISRADLDPAKTWEVRVMRATPAYAANTQTADFVCPSIRCFQKVDYATVQLAGQRRIGIEIKATGQLNGMLDSINCIASARVVTATTGTARAASSNPAWAFLDFARGRTNSAGQRMVGVGLADARLDLDLIDDWATFCDDNNLEFNGVFDQRMSCADVLGIIARCGRASVTWTTGKLGVVWDAANQPVVAVFGMANIRAGSFKVQYATGHLADEIVVNFLNRDRNWQRDTLRKAKPGVSNPTNPVELEIFGCTSEDQAGREAALLAAGQQYRRRIITWETDVEGLVVTRGDVVMLSHDLTQWGYSGRVVSFPTAGSVTIDKTVPLTGGDTLMLRAPNGTLTTLTVTNAPGEASTLTGTLPSTAGTTPRDWLWLLGPTATPGKKVKIVSIEPLDDLHARLIAVDEEAGYYAAESDPWSYVAPESVSLLAPRVTRLALVESIAFVNTWLPKVQIDWSTENAQSALVVVTRNGDVLYNQTASDETSHLEYVGAVGDVFAVSVTPIALTGLRGTVATATRTLDGGNIAAAPPNVTRVNAVYEGKTIWLEWAPVSDYRGVNYEVRWGESWGAGVAYPVGSSLRFKTLGDGNYWVKAKSTNGYYSAAAVGIRIEGSSLVENVIATLDESGTGWSGEFDGAYVEPAGRVSLAGAGLFSSIPLLSGVAPSVVLYGGFDSEGYYTVPDGHVVDIGTPGACSVSAALTFDVHDPTVLFSEHASIAALPSIKCPAGGTGSVDVEMNIAQADGLYAGWQPFKPGTYLARYFDFRLRLTSDTATVSPFVSTWQVGVDVPDRIDSVEVATPTGTLAVGFARPFNNTPKIQATVINATAGDDIIVSDVTPAGFNLVVKNGGSSVARTVHYLAQGY